MSQYESGPPENNLPRPAASGTSLHRFVTRSQQDFERMFFENVLKRCPDFAEILRVLGYLYTEMGLYTQGLKTDRRLARLLPDDATVHYNLACSYSLLHLTDQAIQCLRRATHLGYRDFEYLKHDKDLDPIRHDPRYGKLLADFDAA